MLAENIYDDYGNVDEDGDFVPLVQSSASSSKQRLDRYEENTNKTMAPLEIVVGAPGAVPSLTNQSKLVYRAFCLLFFTAACIGATSFIASIRDDAEHINMDACLNRFNKTYEQLLEEMADLSTDLCQPDSLHCRCRNPFLEERPPRGDDHFLSLWNKSFVRNVGLVNTQLREGSSYDVVFYGDSITEHWHGTDLGIPNGLLEAVHDVYNEYFVKECGAKIDGLALGIGGDRVGQVLYRLQNGELPSSLEAKVFWVLIGTNDYGGDRCSAESIVAGNIQIVETIIKQRPGARVVLNSILPRSNPPGADLWSGEAPAWQIITTINQWMECYAAENDQVDFFNATETFLQPNTALEVPEYYSDNVHPSAAGHAAWASVIVEQVLELIQD